uniref:Uncharacterized protein n=1 Tax=Cercocebus atys TaxID=9531 RepID=A0A2K5NHI9_CERAT
NEWLPERGKSSKTLCKDLILGFGSCGWNISGRSTFVEHIWNLCLFQESLPYLLSLLLFCV